MSNFISWIEKKDKKGKIILCYLTDRDIFSSYGRRVLSGCKDNDFLGHGAIRRFFRLATGGEHTRLDFWNIHKLPQEISLKIEQFDHYWGKMFRSGFFQTDDLQLIIQYAPEPYKSKALSQLRRQSPSIEIV